MSSASRPSRALPRLFAPALIAVSALAAGAQGGIPDSSFASDPRQMVGRVLSLDDAVAIALASQPQIQARLHDYAAARYRVTQALAPLLPQLSGGVSASWSRMTTVATEGVTSRIGGVTAVAQPVTATTTITAGAADSFLAQISLSQLLFDFGKNLAATEAAQKLAEVSREDIELQRQLIVLSVSEAYNNLVLSRRLIGIKQEAVTRAEQNLLATRRSAEAGVRARADAARTELDLANTQIDLVRATHSEPLARAALNTAMGISVATPTQVEDNLAYEPVPPVRDRLFAQALAQRPELRQARLRVGVTEAQERRAARDFLPDISGTGSYGGSQPDLNENWAIGLSLSWSIFDGGGKIARLREARENHEAARARVQSAELGVLNDVEQSVVALEEAQARIRATRVAVKAAEENFRFAWGTFQAGLGTILDLTDAQGSLTLAREVEALALSDFRLALYRLDRAVGRR